MNESVITLQGWLGSEVTLRRAGEIPVGNFRLACTPRRFNRRTQNWSDGATQWYTVNVWRGLAENCAASLRQGDPVVVHGRLDLRVWVNADNVEVSGFEVEATHVGHDLSRGTSAFTRCSRPSAGQPQEPAQAASPGATEETDRQPVAEGAGASTAA